MAVLSQKLPPEGPLYALVQLNLVQLQSTSAFTRDCDVLPPKVVSVVTFHAHIHIATLNSLKSQLSIS